MGRVVSSIYAWHRHPENRVNVDPKAVAEAKKRASLPETRDNTGLLMGDPPAGRSALDKKRNAELRKLIGWPEIPEETTEDGADE